jgi:hypothetical protein
VHEQRGPPCTKKKASEFVLALAVCRPGLFPMVGIRAFHSTCWTPDYQENVKTSRRLKRLVPVRLRLSHVPVGSRFPNGGRSQVRGHCKPTLHNRESTLIGRAAREPSRENGIAAAGMAAAGRSDEKSSTSAAVCLALNEERDGSDHSALPAPMPENRSFPRDKEGRNSFADRCLRVLRSVGIVPAENV